MHNPDATMPRDSIFALKPFGRMHSGHKFKQWYQSGVNHGCWQYENSCSSALAFGKRCQVSGVRIEKLEKLKPET